MNRAPSRRDLRALRDKYERILALRQAHDRARADRSFVEPNPREAMAALADEFPGALREIDILPMATIEARIHALALAERDPPRAEPWMGAQALFHRIARGALATKRWLRGRKDIASSAREDFMRATVQFQSCGDAARLFADELAIIASPPQGRLMDVVHAKVAAVLEISEVEARVLVFGERRRAATSTTMSQSPKTPTSPTSSKTKKTTTKKKVTAKPQA